MMFYFWREGNRAIIKSMKKFVIVILSMMLGVLAVPVSAMSEAQSNSIVDNCNAIRENLKNVQRLDAKARVFLGGHYEAVLNKFITPLNVRLVENNISNVGLIENQNNFSQTKALFSSDFINYQQGLEDLIATDCKNNPEEFYDKLVKVRQKRKVVEQDTLRLRQLLSEQTNLVRSAMEKI